MPDVPEYTLPEYVGFVSEPVFVTPCYEDWCGLHRRCHCECPCAPDGTDNCRMCEADFDDN